MLPFVHLHCHIPPFSVCIVRRSAFCPCSSTQTFDPLISLVDKRHSIRRWQVVLTFNSAEQCLQSSNWHHVEFLGSHVPSLSQLRVNLSMSVLSRVAFFSNKRGYQTPPNE
eukprot:scaffold228477_cov19-Prasinocladus_malaysianus.AAC.1